MPKFATIIFIIIAPKGCKIGLLGVLLNQDGAIIINIAYLLGFNNNSHNNKDFKVYN